MTQFRRAWALFILCCALVLGAMTWVTHETLRMERAQIELERKARLDEKIHLASGLMDATFNSFLNPESARPHDHYQTTIDTGGKASGLPGASSFLSPLLQEDDSLVFLRFQVDARGTFTSPLAPTGSLRMALKPLLETQRAEQAPQRLKTLRQRVDREALIASMNRQGAYFLTLGEARKIITRPSLGPDNKMQTKTLPRSRLVYQGAYTTFWQDSELLMVRQVWVGQEEYLQGCWFDWPILKEVLLSTSRDLLPAADLAPATEGPRWDPGNRLLAVPIRLIPGPDTKDIRIAPSQLKSFLVLGWGGMLTVGLLAALLLYQSLSLSDRRSAFVSTVSHELRTPLTSFRLNSELLALGMVPAEEQHTFHVNLLAEANRLDLLLKNVLAYARIENRQVASRLEDTQVGNLLDRMRPRLDQRSEQAGMRLTNSIPESVASLTVRTDPSAIEQILFNLVDNACKYAASAEDKTIEILGTRRGKACGILVRDRGPGIAKNHPRLFEPFGKPEKGSARSVPGVGLGLALSRRLARQLGGNLEQIRMEEPGACFCLWIPLKHL